MREIKFRAWDKLKNVMISPDDYDRPIFISQGHAWEQSNDVMITNSNLGLMQFTGLLDKNGKEIYESDLLRVPDDVQQAISEPEIVSVIWDRGGFMTSNHRYIWLVAEYSEIIGNIYENPELIKSLA